MGKGSIRTAIGYGLIVPKPKPNGESIGVLHPSWQKGMRLTFLNLSVGNMRQLK